MVSESVWPFGLTLKLWDKIDITENKFTRVACTVAVDWGPRSRGQGKRIGGCIQGGMSCAPVGVKRYHGFQFNIEFKDRDQLKQFNSLYQDQQYRYTRAISAGSTHGQAMVYALIFNRTEFENKLKITKKVG